MNSTPIRDIHLPEMYGWWPPAHGWWVVFFIILVAFIGAFWLYMDLKNPPIDQQAKQQFKKIVKQFEGDQDKSLLLQALSSLLRRISMTYRTRQQIASLTNDSWIKQLDSVVGKSCFSPEITTLLMHGPYQKQADFNVETLLVNCRQWLQALPKSTKRKVKQNDSV